VTLDDLLDRAVLSVEEAGALLNVGRTAAYDAVRRGELPVLRVGRRMLVPVPALLRLIGYELPAPWCVKGDADWIALPMASGARGVTERTQAYAASHD